MLGCNEYLGLDKEELDTPALLIDLDLMEENIDRVTSLYDKHSGAALRPHQKGHRSPMIAGKQIDAGAEGGLHDLPRVSRTLYKLRHRGHLADE
ncbi:MAG: hypothetical protein ACLFVP_00160 [Candidatus Bathyarchaeia archaeon]